MKAGPRNGNKRWYQRRFPRRSRTSVAVFTVPTSPLPMGTAGSLLSRCFIVALSTRSPVIGHLAPAFLGVGRQIMFRIGLNHEPMRQLNPERLATVRDIDEDCPPKRSF